ncbi:phage protein NinX family protein [Cedecea sp. P7760]|uniref:phage protein NinX family protein n=1 Tax=Cedecea sp. P7760 TaxID=2726983 RepID=UPI0015A21CF0|nr:phage protein NinX family protein [Cedecea sp. P7760]NWC63727.1 DUF2591 family protein [Cedecea sp. P7760]
MTDYSQMSDYEISCEVGRAIGFADYLLARNEQKNYCKSWADAGPIIEQNGIGIYFIGEGHHRGKWGSDAPSGKPYVYGDSLLRNAMIVFLMMQDSSNANPI